MSHERSQNTSEPATPKEDDPLDTASADEIAKYVRELLNK